MHQDDGAVSKILMVQYAVYDDLPAFVTPVDGVHTPLDSVVAAVFYCVYGGVVIVSVRKTEETHVYTGQVFCCLMGFLDLGGHVLRGEFGERGMVDAVVSNLMPAGNDALCILRVLAHPVGSEEKCGANIVFFQNIHNGFGLPAVGACVKGQGYPRYVGADAEDGFRLIAGIVVGRGIWNQTALLGGTGGSRGRCILTGGCVFIRMPLIFERCPLSDSR